MTSTRSLYKGACFPLYLLSLNKDVVAPTLVIQSHVVGMASPYKFIAFTFNALHGNRDKFVLIFE